MKFLYLILSLLYFSTQPIEGWSQCTGFGATATLVTQAQCMGECGLMTATPTNGASPYSYEVYVNGIKITGVISDSCTLCQTGAYYFKVTDANNCVTITDTIAYQQPTSSSPLTATTAVTQASTCSNICGEVGVSIQGGTPPYQNQPFSTSGFPLSPYSTITTTGVCLTSHIFYHVVDSFGCAINSDTVAFIVPPFPPINASLSPINPSCNGDANGSVTVNATGGTPSQNGYTYLWEHLGTPVSSPAIGGLLANVMYRVTVTDSLGCSLVDSVLLTEPSPLEVKVIPDTNTICYETIDTIKTIVTGGQGMYLYAWSLGATTNSIPASASGLVTLTITDANACTATDSIMILPQLDSNAISQNLDPFGIGHCENGNSSTLSVNAIHGSLIANGIFYGPGVRNGLLGSGNATFHPDSAVLDMGHYGDVDIFYAYTTTTGCPDTANFQTFVHKRPDLSIVMLPDSLCQGADTIPLIVTNTVTTGNMGQLSFIDTLPPLAGAFLITDNTGTVVTNSTIISLFDSLNVGSIMPYQTIYLSYSYTTDLSLGACANTIYDSVFITDCCVWPGDADDDGITNNYDLLPIGLHYGENGNNRIRRGTDYNCHGSVDWGTPITGMPSIDKKHADCNGDGIINGADTNAIVLNWAQTHLKNTNNNSNTNTGVDLYIDTATTNPGDTVMLNVILNGSLIPSPAYGIAFTINYDPLGIDTNSIRLKFNNSWLGSVGSDLIGIYKDFYNQGQVEVGLTRIDHTPIAGAGALAQLEFIIKDDVLPKSAATRLNFDISGVKLIDNYGVEIPVRELPSQILVTDVIMGASQPSATNTSESNTRIMPNPTKGTIIIQNGNQMINSVALFDLAGRKVIKQQVPQQQQTQLNLSNYPSGVYILKVETSNGTENLKIIKQ